MLDEPLTPRTERHVRGRKCWVRFWGVTYVFLYVVALALTQLRWSSEGLTCRAWWCITRMYLCTFIAALGWVWYLWKSTTREGEVPLALLVIVWFTTGTLSVCCCSICNCAMVYLWAWMDPDCYITYPADNWPWGYTSLSCMLTNVVQWILTAGIIEETFKFAALLRLRPNPAAVKRSIDFCTCSFPGLPQGSWLKIADSPLAVALCGVAAGGGLATSENFMYIFSAESTLKAFGQNDLDMAYGRIAASFAHMVWTGYASCGLAKWLFLSPSHPERPRSRASHLLAPIILHGLYNWCATLQKCEEYEAMYEGKMFKTDGCYVPPAWRMALKVGHTAVMLASFYLWHCEFSEIVGDDENIESSSNGAMISNHEA